MFQSAQQQLVVHTAHVWAGRTASRKRRSVVRVRMRGEACCCGACVLYGVTRLRGGERTRTGSTAAIHCGALGVG